MKKIENYDEIKVNENKLVLPVGGYECVIKNVKHFEYNSIKKVSLEIDVANGEFKDYYQNKYDEAWQLYDQGYYQAALELALSLPRLEDKEREASTLCLIGVSYGHLREFQKELEYCSMALDLQPDNIEYKILKAFCLFDIKEYDNASNIANDILSNQSLDSIESDSIINLYLLS